MTKDAARAITDPGQKQLIANVARDLLEKVAPHELPLFPATSQAYFENPEKMLEKQKSEDTMLGFGLEAGAVFLTPAVLAVMTEVIAFIAEVIKDAIKDGSKSVIADYIKKIFHPSNSPSPKTPPPLSTDQVRHVYQLAVEKARQLKLPEAKVQLLAGALLAALAIPPLPDST